MMVRRKRDGTDVVKGRRMADIKRFVDRVVKNVERVIVGKRDSIEFLMVALLCEGHVLIEDVPGTGKTMLARSIAASLGGYFRRLQCTPDLLPNDVTGVSVYNQKNTQFEFRPGPVFVNVLLADEINRATPRTQSALLEAMQEQQVTVDGQTHPLPRPFLVLATQNPIEYEGTFPLPEAQLDRFLIRLTLGYPAAADEKILLEKVRREHPILQLKQVAKCEQLLELQKQVWEIHLDDTLRDYIVRLVGRTRSHPDLALGGSPRASLSLFKTGQALAGIQGRDHVLPDDIKRMLPAVLSHRLVLRPESALRGRTIPVVIEELLADTPLDLGTVR
jgi:MoxR-like ATPase